MCASRIFVSWVRSTDPHQSPIWIQTALNPRGRTLGIFVPQKIVGSRPCPIAHLDRSCGSLAGPAPCRLATWAHRQNTWWEGTVWPIRPVVVSQPHNGLDGARPSLQTNDFVNSNGTSSRNT